MTRQDAGRVAEITAMNLLDALAQSLGIGNSAAMGAPSAQPRTGLKAAGPAVKPVLQFNPFPTTLDANIYRNPRSDSNPNGDLKSLFAFRQLVDPVPSFSEYYSPRGDSTESIYGQIVSGAAMAADSPFTARVIADAQKQFSDTSFADMGGTPGVWRPVYAMPEDWYDTSQEGRYIDLDIDLNGGDETASPFTRIGVKNVLRLSAGGDLNGAPAVDPQTKIRSVSMKYLLVQLRRPWLNLLVFESGGWYLSGQPEGFCSSGKADDNAGVLPLLPTGMLLARDVSIDAEWSKSDQAFIDSANSSNKPVFLGPLAFQAERSSVQIIGWVSSLVPYSPRATDLQPGSILVRNTGSFVARFSVAWQQAGQPTTSSSGDFPVLGAKSISIPSDARNISLKIEIMTFPKPVEAWRTVATFEFDSPVKKCFELSGVTWKPELRDVPSTE
jgi:hypothetical protein